MSTNRPKINTNLSYFDPGAVALTEQGLDKYTKEEYKQIIRKAVNGEKLDSRESTMLFYYARYRSRSEFDFLVNYEERLLNNKKQRKTK